MPDLNLSEAAENEREMVKNVMFKISASGGQASRPPRILPLVLIRNGMNQIRGSQNVVS